MNNFYRVSKPFQYLKLMGHRLSNTWVGSSRVMDPIYQPVMAFEGQVFHDLVGGLFADDEGGEGHQARFTDPVHIFEAKYHTFDEPFARDRLIKDGFLVETTEPEERPSYADWRAA